VRTLAKNLEEDEHMKAVAFNCSPRKDGNTARLIRVVLEELEREGIATELVQVGKRKIRGCIACYKCLEKKDGKCHGGKEGDILNDCLAKMLEADGIIIGSPTYFANVSTEAKALIDRAGLVSRVNGILLKRKVGGALSPARRAGALQTFTAINYFFLANEMIVPGSSYWNIAYGRNPGEVEKDEEGIKTMRDLGANMAWLLKKLGG
jgi:multimeric flavodoxin WrbA